MEPVISLMVARVVQFSETYYDKNGIFLKFLVDTLRPVIVEGNEAVDIFSHQIFEIVPMIDGIIAIDTLANLDRNSLYAYTVQEAIFPEQVLPTLLVKAFETYRWYHEVYNAPSNTGKSNIISFEKAKQRLMSKKRK